jgi:hypothetical protein
MEISTDIASMLSVIYSQIGTLASVAATAIGYIIEYMDNIEIKNLISVRLSVV